MSRTDKDRPWQIIAQDRYETAGLAYYHHNHYSHSRIGTCDDGCGWTLPYWMFNSPTREQIRVYWNGPERSRERIHLGRLAGEYNAHGDLSDGDFANFQHHHSVEWLIW
jgi:hypothetical protein